jgi:hypothetical protein
VQAKLEQQNMEPSDLNKLWPEVTWGFRDEQAREVRDNSVASVDGAVNVYFRNLQEHLIQHIREARMVVGCVAWLTNAHILKALSEVAHGVAIVVQKEDFLRPDLGADASWKRKMRAMYGALKADLPAPIAWPGLIGNLSLLGGPDIDPVRCVGNHNQDRRLAFPRMHNKFLVFCRPEFFPERDAPPVFDPKPYAVWTGSFNLTHNAALSLENALFITDPNIVEAYYREWEQIQAISEGLNWDNDWAEPEHRIGT